MKLIVWFVAASLFAVVGSSRAQDKSDPPLNLDTLERLYGTRMKSVAVKEISPKHSKILTNEDKAAHKTTITITLEFTRSVTTLQEFRLLQETFAASTGTPYRFDVLPLIFHLFDEDNVCIDKLIISAVEGDVSGLKGEAFRISLTCPTDIYKRVKKIEARYYLPVPK